MKKLSLSTKAKIKTGITLSLLGAFLLMSYQNCSPGDLSTNNQAAIGGDNNGNGNGAGDGNNNNGNGGFSDNGNSMEPVIDSKPVQTAYSENILISMLNATGVQTPSAATRASFADKSGRITETGKADTVTAPMWQALTLLSADVCLDLINQEKAITQANRRIFPQVNFTTGPANVSAAAKADVIRRLARSLWGRLESEAEKTMIVSAANTAFTGVAATGAQTENLMLFTCTGMLAALDAQKF